METIYKDEKRELGVDGGNLVIVTSRGNRTHWLSGMQIAAPQPAHTEAIRKAGEDPIGWYAIQTNPANVYALLPPQTREAVEAAISNYKASRDAVVNDPANVARREVNALFAKARAREDYPGEYFPLLQKAETALKAWKDQYPEAAEADRKAALKAEAEHKRHLAADALTFDADGWYDEAERQKRHDALIAEAEAIEARI